MWTSAKKVLKERARRGGFASNPAHANGVLFSTVRNASTKAYYLTMRIGREVAKKAGLSAGDVVHLKWEDGMGIIEAVPEEDGWTLVSGDPKRDDPPLVFRFTWAEKIPSIHRPALLENLLIPSSRTLKFKFPPGTSFSALAVDDPKFNEHKEIMEKHEFKTARKNPKKVECSFKRRSSDKAPEIRDGKPYGRRQGD